MSSLSNLFWQVAKTGHSRTFVVKQSFLTCFSGILFLIGCKSENEKTPMNQDEKKLIEMCSQFAKRADALEKRAFHNGEYKLKQFVPDFNLLFDMYAHGTNNRTISGLNFRNPPRYDALNSSVDTIAESLSETRYRVTFEGAKKWESVRFILDKKQSEWKLICFETYVGIANQGENKGEEIWTKQKL